MSECVGKVLYTEEQIRNRAKELGAIISKEYEGKKLVVIGTLKGAYVWMADLLKEINNDLCIDFVVASSYGSGTTTSGVVKIKKDIEVDIYKKDVIIVEDIVDTGTTLKALKKYLGERNPNSIKICSLLDKPERRLVDIKVDYVGFEIPNLFVVGYGLDFDQRYRNLPYISCLEG